ncbi:hypothetical protein RRF57_002066 [Xylaria bambusicola]|uniref:Uncharacterized protein n=1 Tax=Xylaria bambusicola TaxID=326684 RepID=A0AAN7UJQ8_9PEZI
MSRHQAYRNYDYENDLDEYESATYSDDEYELDPEDQGAINPDYHYIPTLFTCNAISDTLCSPDERWYSSGSCGIGERFLQGHETTN